MLRLPTPQRLQTRLTVLYAAMFGLVLVGVCGLTWAAVSAQARRTVERDLTVTGVVYDRVWRERDERVRTGAEVLARDFGFRAALASHDRPTIASAVENLRERLQLDTAFAVDADGAPVAAVNTPPVAAEVAASLARTGEADGVVTSGDAPLEIVTAPIYAPELQGWIVFGTRLDARHLAGLGSLSTLPLAAEVVHEGPDGWSAGSRPVPGLRFPKGVAAPGRLQGPGGTEYAVLRPLNAPDGAPRAALLLHYPVAAAMAPYRLLLWLILSVGLMGMALVVAGSWLLARSVTRPVAALATAVRRLREGAVTHVEGAGAGGGEVGALADGFNAMVDAVAEREDRIRRAALSDPETALPNRRALEQEVAWRSAQEPERRLAAAAFAIDRFARMRGVLGSTLAIDVVTRLADRLRSLEPSWTVGRTAGDILTVVMAVDDPDTAEARVEAVRRELEAAVPVGGHLVDVRLSTGVSFGPAGHLIRDAELALDAARMQGVRAARFDETARRRAADSLALMPELRRALAGDGLALAHQPKWDVRRRAIGGVESLVRWAHPERGAIPPDAFIPLAEETGDIRALTEWVVTRAMAEQASLAAGGARLPFSINLSGRLVGDREATRWLLDALSRASGPVCLEVTETAVIGDPQAALATFAALREAGVGVSIDDYGSGLSSLAYLKRIAATELKLDRSLVVDVAASARDALLIRSTVNLAHGLGMEVVAEGVEDGDTQALLAGMGCDLIQGWHVSRPLPLEALSTFLADPVAAPAGAAFPQVRALASRP